MNQYQRQREALDSGKRLLLTPPDKGGGKRVVGQFDVTASYFLKQAPKKRGQYKKKFKLRHDPSKS